MDGHIPTDRLTRHAVLVPIQLFVAALESFLCLGATGHLAAGTGHVGAVGAASGLAGLWALGGAFGTGGCASLEGVSGHGVSRCCRCD